MKKLVYTISILLITCSIYAQDLTDALRYSNYKISGTARSAAMGNAFGALGGDFTSLSINPAGIAVYRTGEFTFTPSFGKSSVDGTYLGNTTTDSKYNIGIDNIGYVTTIPTGSNSESGMVSFSFGLGFNKLGSFSMNALAEGAGAESSLLGYFSNNANDPKMGISQYYEQLAIDANLIYQNKDNMYVNDISIDKYGQSVQKTIDRKGYINEYLISLGANFNHKFYVGATVGIHEVYFKENANLYEWDANDNIFYFNDLGFNTYLKTNGSGFNLKVGAIYKPTENLRLGFALHTPTFYKLNDEYDHSMSSSITYDDGVTEKLTVQNDKAGVYDYKIETPMKAILSGAYVIGKSGLISVDYEIVDYSKAKIRAVYADDNFNKENQTIQNAYKRVGNLHIGGEYRVNKSFSLRAGYENYPSVYNTDYLNTENPNGKSTYSAISGGFGFKQGNFFFDATLKQIMIEDYIKIYPDPNAYEMIKNNTTQNNVIFTLGYKF
jgi:hypothetical protein